MVMCLRDAFNRAKSISYKVISVCPTSSHSSDSSWREGIRDFLNMRKSKLGK
ncbi:hypothetical protein M413DRAFT_444298 [Hebeloma cylindrosporum]|uniref:Uncharacterized protein n=1 Tax=Hebeloma cylindrosporum TaxID=76867 RepID=A0A0C2YNN0_HEBCY|nr:hypothetical protein M413DRAFT_444298 [Hebeloma cylindrosporum h7]